MSGLSDHEGTFLSLVLRLQPTTAYQVAKIYEQSPVTNYKTHKGKMYAIIERLVARGLLEKRAVMHDRRGTEQLYCTDAGRDAVREWVLSIQPDHLLPDDPFRTKVQSFGLLTVEEQVRWAVNVRERLREKLKELEAYGGEVDVPFKTFVHDNAVRSLRMRMDWLESLIANIVSGPGEASVADRVA